MQDSLFSDLQQILPHLAALENKIDILRTISRNLDDSTIEIVIYFKDKTTVYLDNTIVPFNLTMETKSIIEDSIDELQRQHDHLKKLLDETNP